MTKTFWETINEQPLRVSSQFRDHPAEQGFCAGSLELSAMTDWSCCTQTRCYDRLIVLHPDPAVWPTAIRYDRLYCEARPDTTQSISTTLILYFFLNRNRGTTGPNRPRPYTKRGTGTGQPFYFTRTDPKQISLKWVDIRCFRNFEKFQMNFVQSFAPMIHGM